MGLPLRPNSALMKRGSTPVPYPQHANQHSSEIPSNIVHVNKISQQPTAATGACTRTPDSKTKALNQIETNLVSIAVISPRPTKQPNKDDDLGFPPEWVDEMHELISHRLDHLTYKRLSSPLKASPEALPKALPAPLVSEVSPSVEKFEKSEEVF